TLAVFAVVALVKVYSSHPAHALHVSADWLNPFAISSTSALIDGVLVAVFIYWGWDSLVSVNEETEDAERVPGVAAVVSTLILVGIYVVVSIAAGLPWRAVPGRQLGRRPQRARQGRARLPLEPAADRRGADVGVRVHPDDDP